MKCPKCENTEEIKWFLRHQKLNEDDTGTNANVITVLCTVCGHNESKFLEDYLDTLFPEWDENREQLIQMLSQLPIEEGLQMLENVSVEEEDEKEADLKNEL